MHPLPSRFILILNKAEVDHEQTLFISFPHQSSCEGHALAPAAPSRPCRLSSSSSSLTAIAASRRPLPPPPPLPLPLDPATAAPSPPPLPPFSFPRPPPLPLPLLPALAAFSSQARHHPSSYSLTAIAPSRRSLPPPPPLPLPLDPATAAPSPFPLPALSPSRSVRAHCHRYPRFRATCTRASKMWGCERSVGEPIVFGPALWITTKLTLSRGGPKDHTRM